MGADEFRFTSSGEAGGDRSLVRLAIFRRLPNAAPILLGVTLVTVIAALDWATGPQVSVSLLYVLAVMAVAWTGTRRHGVLVAILASVESLAAHVASFGFVAIPFSVFWNALARLVVLVLVVTMLGSLRRALVAQRRLAMVDPLSGALNRRAFQIAAERERLRSGRDGGPLSLAYFDIDRFKEYNDRLGHRTGDQVLAEFAATVTAGVRATDLFGRIGGDEFVLLLPETDARSAMQVVDRIRRSLTEVGDDEPITVSVGIATYRFPPPTVDALIAGADDQMYLAKQQGGDVISGTVVVGPWTRWSDHASLTRPGETTRVF